MVGFKIYREKQMLVYNSSGGKLIVDDIDYGASGAYTAKIIFICKNNKYAYEIEFTESEGVKDFLSNEKVQKRHKKNDTYDILKRLIELMEVGIQLTNLPSHVEPEESEESNDLQVIINWSDNYKFVKSIYIRNHDLRNMDFNNMMKELTSVGISPIYNRTDEMTAPEQFHIGGTTLNLSDKNVSDIRSILYKYGIDIEANKIVKHKKNGVEHTYYEYY